MKKRARKILNKKERLAKEIIGLLIKKRFPISEPKEFEKILEAVKKERNEVVAKAIAGLGMGLGSYY